MTYSAGSGGTSSISTSRDVALSSLRADQVLGYNAGLQKWQNITIPSSVQALPEHYGAIGDGTNDDTAAMQAALDSGNNIYLDPTQTYNLTSSLTMTTPKQSLSGGGLLSFSNGLQNGPGIVISADGCMIANIRMSNPNLITTTTGPRSTAISAACNELVITGCTIDRFQGGIQVSASGEYQNIIITQNRIKDVIGSGGGSGDISNVGEDRGDGIVIWGGSGNNNR